MNESYTDTSPHSANHQPQAHTPDIVILGGGCAGLWTLDKLRSLNYDAYLIETNALGAGQTIWSQGILHSGLKYTLAGSMNKAARAIQHMPDRWMQSINNLIPPDLSKTALRSTHCHLWRTQSLSSRAGMIGARIGLRTKPKTLDQEHKPTILQHTPGTVAKLNEPVIDPQAFLANMLALHTDRILHAPSNQLQITGTPEQPTIHTADLTLTPRKLIITAGNGSNSIRQKLNLPTSAMQVRPLKMVVVQSPSLPTLNGHCVDGNATRLTITTQQAANSTSTTWQLGGNIAERGPSLQPRDLITQAKQELLECLPGIESTNALQDAKWMTYDAPRAEGATPTGKRPESPSILHEANTITAWPSKLVLAPQTADNIATTISHAFKPSSKAAQLPPRPQPPVAQFPWDEPGVQWTTAT